MAMAYLAIPVHAQTVSISNLQYPHTIIVNKQLTVSFTVSYSGASHEEFLAIFIWNPQNFLANGYLVSSNPQTCKAPYSDEAICAFKPSSDQGSEDVVFSLPDTSVGTLSFDARAILGSMSTSCASVYNLCVDADSGDQPVTIFVSDKVTLAVSIPSQVSLTLDGIPQGSGVMSLRLLPGTHEISVPAMVQLDSTSRLVFIGWSDGSNQTTRAFDLEADTVITGNYVTQYLISAPSDSTLQAGWYDDAAVVQLSLSQTPLNEYRVLTGGFDGWFNNGRLVSKSPTASFIVDGPVNLTVRWNYLPYLSPFLIVFIVVAILYLSKEKALKMLKDSKKRKSRPKPAAVTSETQSHVDSALEDIPTRSYKPIETGEVKCRHCGAEVPPGRFICDKCGMPARYL